MEQYTFTPKEQETLNKLAQFQERMEEVLKESNPDVNISYIKYYEKFQMQNVNFSDVFMLELKDKDDQASYHLFTGKSELEILSIDKDRNLIVAPSLEPFFNDINFEEEIQKNEIEGQSNLTGISENLPQEEIQKKIEEKGLEKGGDNKLKKVSQDLNKEFNQNLKITSYREIEDNDQMKTEFPSLSGSEEVGLAYSETLNANICVKKDEKENGEADGEHFKKVEEIEPSQFTYKTVISMDEKGNQIEKKVPHALMKTNDDTKEMSITIGDYGYIETGIVRRLPSNERLEYQLRENGEGEEGRASKEIRDIMNKGGTEKVKDLANEFNENEEQGMEEQNLENIDNDNILELSDGTTTTFEEEAAKAKMSVEGFKKLYENAEGKTVDEKLEGAHDESNEEFSFPMGQPRKDPKE